MIKIIICMDNSHLLDSFSLIILNSKCYCCIYRKIDIKILDKKFCVWKFRKIQLDFQKSMAPRKTKKCVVFSWYV